MKFDELMSKKTSLIIERLNDQYKPIILENGINKLDNKDSEILESYYLYGDIIENDLVKWLQDNCPDNEYDEYGNVTNFLKISPDNIDDVIALIKKNNTDNGLEYTVAVNLIPLVLKALDYIGETLGFKVKNKINHLGYVSTPLFFNKENAKLRHKPMYAKISQAMVTLTETSYPKAVINIIQDWFSETGEYYKEWSCENLQKVIENVLEEFEWSSFEYAEDICRDVELLKDFILKSEIYLDTYGHYVSVYWKNGQRH